MYVSELVLNLLQTDDIVFKVFDLKLFQQVRFWYRLSQGSQLSVFKRTALDGNLEKLCDISGLPEMQWTKVTMPIESAAGDLPFQVIRNYIFFVFITFTLPFFFFYLTWYLELH